MSSFFEIAVADGQDSLRLDVLLTQAMAAEYGSESYSRARVQQLIKENFVTAMGQVSANPAKKVRAGEVYSVDVPAVEASVLVPEQIDFEILYEDDDLLVLDKPAGLAVHPSPGHATGTLVHGLLWHCRDALSGINGEARPGIVHRLDKDTSGVMVVAKHDRAHRALAKQFAAHTVEREYHALVRGLPVPAVGTIETNIGRDPQNRLRRAVVGLTKGGDWVSDAKFRSQTAGKQGQVAETVANLPDDEDEPGLLASEAGKHAVTHYRVLEKIGERGAALVSCKLETGRTHQIRVHMTHLGHPLLNDPMYTGRLGRHAPLAGLKSSAQVTVQALMKPLRGQALHAAVLGFEHPTSREWVQFDSPYPPALTGLIEGLRHIYSTAAVKA